MFKDTMGEVEGTVLGELLLIHRSEFSELDFFFQSFRFLELEESESEPGRGIRAALVHCHQKYS
jgi:hypothetical protein